MLVVTIEIWPWGTEELKYQIGEISAANITALGPVSTYEVCVHQNAYDAAGVAEICKEFVPRDHHRSAGPLGLIRDVLAVAVPKLDNDTVSKTGDERSRPRD